MLEAEARNLVWRSVWPRALNISVWMCR